MTGHQTETKIGRNDPCPCGSGKKYKQCCLGKRQPAISRDTAATAPPLFLLSQADRLERDGQFAQAETLYRQILAGPASRTEQGSAHFGLARSMMQLGTGKYAVRNMEQAVELCPEDTQMVIDVANTLSSMLMPEKVIAITKLGLQKTPLNVDLLTYQGLSLERLNRMDEARAVLGKALEIAPEEASIVPEQARVLRRLKEFSEAESLLLSTKQQFEGSPLLLGHLWNELGHVYDETGQFDKAFNAFEECGKASLSSSKAQALDDTLREAQIDDNLKWIKGGGLTRVTRSLENDGRKLAFLVGFPRSGTTLTEQVMAAHSRIISSEEQPYLRDATAPLLKRYGAARPINEVLEEADEAAIEQARSAFWRKIDQDFGSDHDVFVYKLPLSIVSLGTINAIFPSAKIIVALRDPRDVCLSCFFQHFGLNRSMKKFLSWQTTYEYYAKVMGFWLAVRDQIDLSFIEIKYEDTITDLPHQAERLLEHLGVEWEDQVLSYYEKTRQKYINTPSYQAVREDVYTRAMNRWKNYPEPTAEALPVLKPFIEAFGYDKDGG